MCLCFLFSITRVVFLVQSESTSNYNPQQQQKQRQNSKDKPSNSKRDDGVIDSKTDGDDVTRVTWSGVEVVKEIRPKLEKSSNVFDFKVSSLDTLGKNKNRLFFCTNNF